MNKRWMLRGALLLCGAAALLSGCLSTAGECLPGEVLWNQGSDPQRDAPKWIKGGKPAYKEAGVRKREIPDKFLVYVGLSEDKTDERSAQFAGVEDMLKRYGFWLQEELDELLPRAAREAKAVLPNIDTALGAYNAVIYLPRENAQYIRASWQAEGRGCDTGEAVFRVYVLGLFDRETRREHLLEAAEETFKHVVIRAEVKDEVLREFEKLIRRL